MSKNRLNKQTGIVLRIKTIIGILLHYSLMPLSYVHILHIQNQHVFIIIILIYILPAMTVFSSAVPSAYQLAAVLLVTTISTTDAGYSRTCQHGYTGHSSGTCGSGLADLVQLICSSSKFSFYKREFTIRFSVV